MAVKSWSSTQRSVTTSSGEAEYFALAHGRAEALGLAATMRDSGWEFRIRVCRPFGRGMAQHVEVRFFSFQEVVRQRHVDAYQVRGYFNPPDTLTSTKALSELTNTC